MLVRSLFLPSPGSPPRSRVPPPARKAEPKNYSSLGLGTSVLSLPRGGEEHAPSRDEPWHARRLPQSLDGHRHILDGSEVNLFMGRSSYTGRSFALRPSSASSAIRRPPQSPSQATRTASPSGQLPRGYTPSKATAEAIHNARREQREAADVERMWQDMVLSEAAAHEKDALEVRVRRF